MFGSIGIILIHISNYPIRFRYILYIHAQQGVCRFFALHRQIVGRCKALYYLHGLSRLLHSIVDGQAILALYCRSTRNVDSIAHQTGTLEFGCSALRLVAYARKHLLRLAVC